ncbi:hypothetical protein EJB05_45318, partial [Eragrostis curvula]
MWVGEHRPSEVLKAVASGGLELTKRQLASVCGLQESSMEAKDAPSQAVGDGRAAARAGRVAALCGGRRQWWCGQSVPPIFDPWCVVHLFRDMVQGDLFRQQKLQEMRRTLNTRQTARALLIISDYVSRLRGLSSLWLARPRDV